MVSDFGNDSSGAGGVRVLRISSDRDDRMGADLYDNFCLLAPSFLNPWFCIFVSVSSRKNQEMNSWFSHDVIKIQTKKLSLLLSFYFHVILEHLKTFIQTNFRFKGILCFAIQDAWIFRLLRDAPFSWRPGKLLCGLKTLRIFGDLGTFFLYSFALK